MQKKTVKDVEVRGKRVLVRVDFNVPLDPDGKIEDDSRIRACLPTIIYLTGHGARVILCSHLGRPHGRVDIRLRLEPVARCLSDLLGIPVEALRGAVGPGVEQAVSAMQDGDIVMLENLRFYPGEEENDPGFARDLSSLADLFVNDAFGASHRTHASIVGIASHLPCVAGLLMEKEIEQLSSLFEDPPRPFALIMGGAKVEEKIGILENIIPHVDLVLTGGGVAAAFLQARGYSAGSSPSDPATLVLVKTIIKIAETFGVRILLPEDVVVTAGPEPGGAYRRASSDRIPAGFRIADIGPLTIAGYTRELQRCRTVAWNGPLGIFEIPQFSEGTKAIAAALAGLDAITVIGGGSTAEAVTQLGLVPKMTHVSTGGGAFLRFLSGKTLPGLEVLADRTGQDPS
ncbi:phosphoglycerate kinase [Methanoregula sp.]|uniref:phosphoglycerate kinase n=1 Tax=Methanoregula sp. TaxID=2052170 RepID=UPI003BAE27C7